MKFGVSAGLEPLERAFRYCEAGESTKIRNERLRETEYDCGATVGKQMSVGVRRHAILDRMKDFLKCKDIGLQSGSVASLQHYWNNQLSLRIYHC